MAETEEAVTAKRILGTVLAEMSANSVLIDNMKTLRRRTSPTMYLMFV
jgi:hypothetical protein